MKAVLVATASSLPLFGAWARYEAPGELPDITQGFKVSGADGATSAQQATSSKFSSGPVPSRLMWVDATGKSFAAYDNQAAILVINGKITYTTSMYYTCASM